MQSSEQIRVGEGLRVSRRDYLTSLVAPVIASLVVSLIVALVASVYWRGSDDRQLQHLTEEQNYIKQRIDRIYDILVEQRK